MMAEPLADEHAFLRELVGDQPSAWDLTGELPIELTSSWPRGLDYRDLGRDKVRRCFGMVASEPSR